MRRWIRQRVAEKMGKKDVKLKDGIRLSPQDLKKLTEEIDKEYKLNIPIRDMRKMKTCEDIFQYIKERR